MTNWTTKLGLISIKQVVAVPLFAGQDATRIANAQGIQSSLGIHNKMSCLEQFSERVLSEWLPSFCDPRADNIVEAGFVGDRLSRVTEFDAKWFLAAVDAGYVTESEGFFLSSLSKAKETIFWADSRADNPRKIWLWLEPIITVGALARLVDEFGWPASQLGLQSKHPWPFDLVGYDRDQRAELLACEVKKDIREVDKMIELMDSFCSQPALGKEPANTIARNAYRKVVGIRNTWPPMFWALGPGGYSKVFRIVRADDGDVFTLKAVDDSNLSVTD